MFQENTASPRRKYRRSMFKNERYDKKFTKEDEDFSGLQRSRSGRQRPVTKRTLHYLMKLWPTAGEECLQILDSDPECELDTRLLRSR